MPTPPARINPYTLERAITWLVALQDENCNEPTRQAFRRWLKEHDSHALAYAEAENLWSHLGQVKNMEKPALDTARNAKPQPWRSGIIGLFLAAVSYGWWLDYSAPTVDYRTGIGQRHGIDLADGSHIELDARTQLSAKLSWCRRQLILQNGQALFEVSHEGFRPFIVQVGKLRVRDIGTRFDITKQGEAIQVAVLDGEVTLKPDSDWLESALPAGYSRSMTADGRLLPIAPLDSERTESWLTGGLLFDRTPLSEIVTELERYHDVRFIFTDPTLARQTMSGRFDAANLTSFLRALQTTLPVRVQRKQELIILSHARGTANTK
ncbi:MAG: FecR family protein [Methylobacter sp.]|nr:FecR family protein [Methylobacter sp.]